MIKWNDRDCMLTLIDLHDINGKICSEQQLGEMDVLYLKKSEAFMIVFSIVCAPSIKNLEDYFLVIGKQKYFSQFKSDLNSLPEKDQLEYIQNIPIIVVVKKVKENF
jgi:hypothetical protein